MAAPEVESAGGDNPDVGAEGRDAPVFRYLTPTGDPCPRSLRADGTVEGHGHCHGCGYCLGLQWAVWG